MIPPPLSLISELFEHSAHPPIVINVHLQYQTTGYRAITFKEMHEPG
jgi:hypothetical protein